MHNYKQKSKKPTGKPTHFIYNFIYKNKAGEQKEIEVIAKNDRDAKQLVELALDGVKISKKRSKEKVVNPAPINFHLGEHISTICNCGVDYSTGGGNCAHYVCNRDLWRITNQDGITYNCPSGYGIQANDVKDYCASHPQDWQSKANANSMTGQGLVFGVKTGRIIHVGIFNSRTSVYHYGFTARRVLMNSITWWEGEYDSLIFYQRR